MGVSAHGSHPEQGENAIGRLVCYLDRLPLEGDAKQAVHFLAEKLGTDPYGERLLGHRLEDALSGPMSCNWGLIEGDAQHLWVKLNYRYPVTMERADCQPAVQAAFEAAGWALDGQVHKEKLYYPAETPLVSALLEVYRDATGDTTGAILGAIQDHIAPALLGRDLDEFEDLTAAVQKALVHNTSAKAAVDMALWDLLGQKYSAPVYRMLGGARRNIVTDITISVNPPEEMARDARTAVQRGYDCLKVKVGIDPELDVARLAAVRQAVGRDIKLRIDANQAWNAKQAVRILNQMQEKGLDIEFVEQPVPAADLEGMQYVTRHADVPVLADESVFSPADALRIMQTGAADLVNIKLMKCGGITNALRIAAAAEVYGVECMIGCMLEAKISVNAAVELACAKKIITRIDLDGPVLCSEDHILGGAVFDEKNITVSDAPGMGIQGFVPGKVSYLD